MTRTDFLRSYSDLRREARQQTKVKFTAAQEANAHAIDRITAAGLWRKNKNRLQTLTPEDWRKQEDRDERTR
jgi:hypothetical protein